MATKNNNKKVDEYDYCQLTIDDQEGDGWDYSIDYILDYNLNGLTKEEKIEYLNQYIRDIEHYRDSL